jgi:hypothetical protein
LAKVTKHKLSFPDPNKYYAVIPYQDINKLFDLLNKHVSQPLPKVKKYEAPKHEAPKYEAPKHEAPKKTITTYRPHVEKKKPRKKPPGRKKVIEICAKNKTSFFALFLFVGRKRGRIPK